MNIPEMTPVDTSTPMTLAPRRWKYREASGDAATDPGRSTVEPIIVRQDALKVLNESSAKAISDAAALRASVEHQAAISQAAANQANSRTPPIAGVKSAVTYEDAWNSISPGKGGQSKAAVRAPAISEQPALTYENAWSADMPSLG